EVPCVQITVEKLCEIDLQICLEPTLLRAISARDKAPELPIGEDGKIQTAAVQIPLDLLRRIFPAAADAGWTVQADVPGLGVGERDRKVPELRFSAAGSKGAIEGRVVQEKGIVRLAALQVCLVLERPAEVAKHRLNERFFEPLLVAVPLHPVFLDLPK